MVTAKTSVCQRCWEKMDSWMLGPKQYIYTTLSEVQGTWQKRSGKKSKSWKMERMAVRCHLQGLTWTWQLHSSNRWDCLHWACTRLGLLTVNQKSGKGPGNLYQSLTTGYSRGWTTIVSNRVLTKLYREGSNLWLGTWSQLNSVGRKTNKPKKIWI